MNRESRPPLWRVETTLWWVGHGERAVVESQIFVIMDVFDFDEYDGVGRCWLLFWVKRVRRR